MKPEPTTKQTPLTEEQQGEKILQEAREKFFSAKKSLERTAEYKKGAQAELVRAKEELVRAKKYAKLSCDQLGDYLRSFMGFGFSNTHLAQMSWADINHYATPEGLLNDAEEAIDAAIMFDMKRCGK